MIELAGHADGAWGWAFGIGHAALCLLAMVLTARQLGWHARRARATPNDRPLTEGPVMLRGVVRRAAAAAPIEVHIDQLGTEQHTRGGTRHRWIEVARRVHSEDFWLEVPGRGRVRVVAHAPVLAAPLVEDPTPRPRGERTMVARLDEGHTVTVSGELRRGEGAGYRGEAGWVLHAPRAALFAGDEASEADRRSTGFYERATLFVVLWLAIGQLLMAASFYLVATRAERGEAEIWSTHDSDRDRHDRRGYRISASIRSGPRYGVSVHASVTERSWRTLHVGERVPWLVVPDWPVDQAGDRPAAPLAVLVVLALGTLALGAGVRQAHQTQLAWWYQRRVTHEGPGLLPTGTG